jgi:hypothetical protein
MFYPALFLTLLVAGVLAPSPQAHRAPSESSRVVVDDFSGERPGDIPRRWKLLEGREMIPTVPSHWTDTRYFRVVREGGRQFLRAYTHNAVARVIMPNDSEGMSWDLREHRRLSWEWRAAKLPEGAREDRVNDTGGALYVTFDMDWLGRPRSIKYTYSSTLPVGSVVNFGRLKVIVVSSGADGIGAWKRIDRDVAADFRRVFGGEPPARPLSIALWSDTDDTRAVAQVDFDNIVLLRGSP